MSLSGDHQKHVDLQVTIEEDAIKVRFLFSRYLSGGPVAHIGQETIISQNIF